MHWYAGHRQAQQHSTSAAIPPAGASNDSSYVSLIAPLSQKPMSQLIEDAAEREIAAEQLLSLCIVLPITMHVQSDSRMVSAVFCLDNFGSNEYSDTSR